MIYILAENTFFLLALTCVLWTETPVPTKQIWLIILLHGKENIYYLEINFHVRGLVLFPLQTKKLKSYDNETVSKKKGKEWLIIYPPFWHVTSAFFFLSRILPIYIETDRHLGKQLRIIFKYIVYIFTAHIL